MNVLLRIGTRGMLTLQHLSVGHDLFYVVFRLREEVKYVDDPPLDQLGQLFLLVVLV
jgi:hypothetical protein